jgi:hypothetical protein
MKQVAWIYTYMCTLLSVSTELTIMQQLLTKQVISLQSDLVMDVSAQHPSPSKTYLCPLPGVLDNESCNKYN